MAYKKSNANGQGTMANSEPVVIASDQTALLVTVSGVATSAKQDTGNTSVASIDTKTPALGQALAADSVPVILPAATVTTLTPPAAITGFGTAANQTTIIGHVDGIETAIASTNTKLDTVNTNLGTIDGRVDGLEASNSAIQTAVQLLDDTIFTDDAAFTPGTSKVQAVGFLADETATDSVDEGDAGAARMTLDRKQIVTTYAHAAGGATPYKLVSAATTNATSVKASAGTVYMITASNVNAAARYLKLYNKASAPTVGTDVPVLTLIIPGNTAGAGTNIPVPACGLAFSTGIAFALTTEATDAGTTGVAVSEIVINLAWI